MLCCPYKALLSVQGWDSSHFIPPLLEQWCMELPPLCQYIALQSTWLLRNKNYSDSTETLLFKIKPSYTTYRM